MTYTPGPWTWFETQDGFYRVIPESGGFVVAELTVRNPFCEEQRANAQLIAAAPKMLEMLRRVWQHLDPDAVQFLASLGAVDTEYDAGDRGSARAK
jgi:hypothetical protein